MRFETKAIRTQIKQTEQREHSTPLFLTSSFTFENAEQARALFAREEKGNIYSRFSNPNSSELEEKIALLEGTEDAYCTASGMSAIFASMAAFLKTGDHIISSRSVFGNTHKILTEILPGWGIEVSYVNIRNQEEWEKAIQSNTKMIFAETPSNPGLDIIDLEWLGGLCRSNAILLNIDNCFATPYLQNPAEYGADIITHSGTKFLDGQGRVLGGIVTGKEEYIGVVRQFCRRTGPALSPFNAWILSKSLETLSVRMERHCENAFRLAKLLEKHEDVIKVIYPFLDSHPHCGIAKKQMKLGGAIVSFEIRGGIDRGIKFLDSLHMCSLTANLGDTRTIVTHPASTTHSRLSETERKEVYITDGLIRISVGLEHIEDIMHDITQAILNSR